MTRREHMACATGIGGLFALGVIAVLLLTRCGGAADNAARTAAYVIQSLCAPTATVQECTDTLLERAEYLRGDGGNP